MFLVALFRIATRSAYIPIVRVLFKALDCHWAAGVLVNEMNAPCWSGQHVSFAVPALLALFLYLPLAHRFVRVAGRLQNIEFDIQRPFAMDADIKITTTARTIETASVLRVQHALSTRNATYLTRVTMAKTVMLVFAVFFGSVPLLPPIIYFICGVAMLVSGVKEPPVSSRVANLFRIRFDLALCWYFICAIVASAVQFSEGTTTHSGSAADLVLTILPVGCFLPFLQGWFVHVVASYWRRRRAAASHRITPMGRR
jgi:hypothetical protein